MQSDFLDQKIVLRADLGIFEGTVSARGIQPKVFRQRDLLVVGKRGEILTRKTKHVHKIIPQRITQVTGKLVVQKVYVKTNVMPNDDIIPQKRRKVP